MNSVKPINTIAFIFLFFAAGLVANDTFTPYEKGQVPQDVVALCKDYDPQKESLDVKAATFRIFLKEAGAKHNLNMPASEWMSYVQKIEMVD